MTVVMIVLAFTINKVLRYSNIANRELSHSLNNLNRLQQTLTTLLDAETAERGYVITGNIHFLQPFENTRRSTLSIIHPDSLKQAMPEYVNEIEALNKAVDKKFTYTDRIVQYALVNNKSAAVQLINSGEEKTIDG